MAPKGNPMSTLTISKIARKFGLSRSTLLYYERIGLLKPSERTESGYRVYTEDDTKRLERICMFKSTGLPLEKILSLLESKGGPSVRVLENRLEAIQKEIDALRLQQTVISNMLGHMGRNKQPTGLTKTMMTDLLRVAGLDDHSMMVWHVEFEKRDPKAHHDFLLYLGITEKEAFKIREHAHTLNSGENDACKP